MRNIISLIKKNQFIRMLDVMDKNDQHHGTFNENYVYHVNSNHGRQSEYL